MYSIDNNATTEASLKVVRAGRRRADGTWEGRVRLNLTAQADVRVKLALRVPRAVGDASVRVRVGAGQERREECAAYEDPRARVRAGEGQVGAGRCCARARQAQTVAAL